MTLFEVVSPIRWVNISPHLWMMCLWYTWNETLRNDGADEILWMNGAGYERHVLAGTVISVCLVPQEAWFQESRAQV